MLKNHLLLCGMTLTCLLFAANCSTPISSGEPGSGSGTEDGGPIGGADDDLASPGEPAVKEDHASALALSTVQGTADHYDFQDNPENYRTLTEALHGTEVNVAVHNSASVSDADAQTWSENVRDCWHAAWHVFGGYRYDKFAVLVRSPASPETGFSLSEAGVSIGAGDLETGDYEFVCHELIHVWLGKLIAHEPDGTDNLFQAETWVSEGAVVYYSFRILADVIGVSEYTSGMNGRYSDYDEARGTSLDLSIADLAELIGQDTSHEAVGVLYARGALISYLLDKELAALGHSLDELLASLYENHGLADATWSQASLETTLQEITGTDFSGFFDTNLDTNAFLDVEGEFGSPLGH